MANAYLDTLNKSKTASRIPIWMMRQAGRYLPEYRNIRKQHSFLDMVYTPDVATEITLQPIRRYGFDAAILFSDILVTPQALGMELRFTEGVGPQFLNPIQSQAAAKSFTRDMSVLSPIYQTIRQLKAELPNETALIGFAGAPFTVASYMIEGGSSKDLKTTKKMMMTDPDLFTSILDEVTDVTIEYLLEQCKAGVDALQIFDTWISHLDWQACQQYSAAYVEKIVSALRQHGIQLPITFFGKQTSVFYPMYASTGVNVISIDWNGHMGRIDNDLDPTIGLQGNLDPFTLYGPEQAIKNAVTTICNSIQSDRPFIFNLGHGLMPDIPVDAVQTVIDTVRSLTKTTTSS